MNREEILKKAIEKAIKNDYDVYICMESNIFSHGFAKSFWGEQEHQWEGDGGSNLCACGDRFYEHETTPSGTAYCWQYHLQQMVLEEDPIEYLEKFL